MKSKETWIVNFVPQQKLILHGIVMVETYQHLLSIYSLQLHLFEMVAFVHLSQKDGAKNAVATKPYIWVPVCHGVRL